MRPDRTPVLERRTLSTDMEQRTATVDLRDTRVEGRTLSGFAALYGVESNPIEQRGRRFTETIEAGAFDDVLDSDPDVVLTVNHDKSRVLGRTSSGTLRLEARSEGLWFECDLGDGPTAQDVRDMVRREDITGMSFEFGVADGGDRWDGPERRTLTKIAHLTDLSLATNGAYNAPRVELRTQTPAARGGGLRIEHRGALSAVESESRASIALAPEQRMSSWQARRRTRSTFSETDARDFSLGRAVRGMVTGDWRDADLEQRAMAEGVDSLGGSSRRRC
jgi:HK97 family phage prohead protease